MTISNGFTDYVKQTIGENPAHSLEKIQEESRGSNENVISFKYNDSKNVPDIVGMEIVESEGTYRLLSYWYSHGSWSKATKIKSESLVGFIACLINSFNLDNVTVAKHTVAEEENMDALLKSIFDEISVYS